MRSTVMFILMLFSEGFMAQVHLQETSLADLVKWSEAILIVEKAAPFTVKDTVVLAAAGKNRDYVSERNRFVISEVLKAESPDWRVKLDSQLVKGATLEVYEADHQDLIKETKLYMTDPMPRSKFVRVYAGGSEKVMEGPKQFIVFLKYQAADNTFEFYVKGACESLKKKAKVRKLMAAK